jgi:hypothetical protein
MRSTCSCSRSITVITEVRRTSRGRNVIAKRAAFGVALIGVTPTTDTTPATFRVLADGRLDVGAQPLHLGERDLVAAFHHREDQTRVLLRQEALRNDQIEPEGRGHGGEQHQQRQRLVAEHPFERPAVGLDRPFEGVVEEARDGIAGGFDMRP